MIKTRLLKLAARLEKIAAKRKPARQFDLLNWYAKDRCGTTACAVGEACLMPEFKKLGLKLSMRIRIPMFNREHGWNAVATFFGIGTDEAEWLFAYTAYPNEDRHNPLAVVGRIRQYVDDNAKK